MQKEQRAAQAASDESRMREKRAQSEFIAIPLFCCSVFFLLTQRTWREQAAVFFIGHMPLHNDLWMQALCRLILLSTHYVAQPSVAIWGREEASPPRSLSYHLSSLMLSRPSYHSLSVRTFSSQLLPRFYAHPLRLKAS